MGIKEDKVKLVKELIATNTTEKRSMEYDMNLNLSFYMGRQWVFANYNGGGLVDRNDFKQKKTTINYIKPTVDTMVARILSPKQQLTCLPKTGNSEDISAAKIAKMVAEAELWDLQNMQVNLLRFVTLMAGTGSFYIHPYFNAKAGAKILAEDVNSGLSEDDPDRWEKDQHEGRIEIDFLSPYEITHDMSAFDDISSEWFIVSKFRSPEWVYRVYGKTAKPGDNSQSQVSDVYNKLSGTSADERNKQSILVHELWHKPTKRAASWDSKNYENGILRVITESGELLYDGDLPWGLANESLLPFIKCDWSNIGDKYYGIPPISEARSPQIQINKTMSMYLSYISNYLFPPILSPEGNGVDDSSFSGRPKEMIQYLTDLNENGGAPRFMEMPSFNPQILDNISIAKNYIDNIFGVHEVSRGGAPTGTKSGRALQILDAADDTRASVLATNLEATLSRYGKIGLIIIANTYKIPRMIRITGLQNARQIKDFTGSALNGNTDLKVKVRPMLPMNKAAAIDTVVSYRQNGIIPPGPSGDKIALQLLDMESLSPALDGGLDEEQANYENSILEEGFLGEEIQVPVTDPNTGQPAIGQDGQPMTQKGYAGLPRNNWDIDEIHIKAIDDRQKQTDYLKVIKENPQIDQAYNLHKENHRKTLLWAQENAAQEQEKQTRKAIEIKFYEEALKIKAEAEAEIAVNDAKILAEAKKEITTNVNNDKDGSSHAEKKSSKTQS